MRWLGSKEGLISTAAQSSLEFLFNDLNHGNDGNLDESVSLGPPERASAFPFLPHRLVNGYSTIRILTAKTSIRTNVKDSL